MRKRIKHLKVKNFRGATTPLELEFDSSKPMVMIFGENGTGKSSIVDAIDFICNKKYGCIEERSSVNKKSHLSSLGKTRNDIEIKLNFGGTDYSANHKGTIPVTSPSGLPEAKILRRDKILNLILQEPVKRFIALKDFLTVPNIEKCEGTLRNKIRNKEQEYGEITQALIESKEQLEDLKNKFTENKKSTEEWAKEITDINEATLQQIINKAEEFERLQEKLNETHILRVGAQTKLKETIIYEESILEKLKFFQDKEETNKGDLLELLKKAKNFIDNHSDTKTCPLCEQNIVTEQIIDRLTQRLGKMEELGKLICKLNNVKKHKESAELEVETREKDYLTCAENLVNKMRGQKQDAEAISGLSFDYDKLIAEITSQDNQAKEELEKYKSYKASMEENKKAALVQQKLQVAIKTMVDTIKTKEEKARKDEEVLKRLKKYEDIVERERKKYVDNILHTVSGEIERLYQKIHPDEGIGGFRLYLKEKAKNSLEYDGDFQNEHNIPPQAYYSDAHLDTLGICMFLALTKHFDDDDTIVILDDVVTSVDEAHRERFLEMLHDEAENFCHMIVTTHYRPWRDIYRIGGGPEKKVHFIDLQLWTKETGIRHSKSRIMVEELKSLKDNITVENRQNIASKAGILLEGILDSLALRYKLKVPRVSPPKYELQELFNAMHKGKKYIKIIQTEDDGNKSEIQIQSLVEDLEKIKWIRNQVGCHWNLDGSLISDTEVKEFAEKTIGLTEVICCQECGSLPFRNGKGESYFKCHCGKKQMYPIQIP